MQTTRRHALTDCAIVLLHWSRSSPNPPLVRFCIGWLTVPLTILIAAAVGAEAWRAILALVKNDSEIMLSGLPNFWRIGKAHIDGKFKKVRIPHTLEGNLPEISPSFKRALCAVPSRLVRWRSTSSSFT